MRFLSSSDKQESSPQSSTRHMAPQITMAVCLVACGLLITLTILIVNRLYQFDVYLACVIRRIYASCCCTSVNIYATSCDDNPGARQHVSFFQRHFQSAVAPWFTPCSLSTECDVSRCVLMRIGSYQFR
jgi:hypothetical protein